ncbi:MAG: response regulator [Nitrospirales bacterium]|nr:response regulator [Nitrospirales bacterium]
MSVEQGHTMTAGMFGGQASEGLVLVVDDEADVRKVARMALEKVGYTVIEAANGEEAIERTRSGENPLLLSVIVTDINMPKVNGLEAIQFFQKEFPSVSLIVMTGYPNLESATELIKQGLVDYLVKPVDKEKLLASVAKAMAQREAKRP